MNRQKNSYHLGTVLFCALSGLILIGVRVVFSTPIEIDGDSIGKWISATALGSGEDWANIEVSHHSLRWAILVPQALVSTLLPGRYENYFLLPIIFYSVFTVVGMIFIRNNLDREVQVAPLLLGVLPFLRFFCQWLGLLVVLVRWTHPGTANHFSRQH